MMRWIAILLLVIGAVPAPGARRVNLAQLEQMVSALHGKPDAEVAFRIADQELTERLSPARTARLTAALPGEKSRQALIAVADASQFQPPPPDEIPASAAPSLAEQRQIMGRVVAYVTRAIPQLPNFIATRRNERFEDTPQILSSKLASIPYEPLHFVDRSEVTVAYRDNREVDDPTGKKRPAVLERGLSSRGEFGSLLSTILLDAAQNKLDWLRWEQGESGRLAAFAYSVAKEKSHFEVDFCCVPDSEGRTHPYREVAGYTGNMLIDPATGTILRLEVVADLKPGGPIRMAKIAVEYGPVDIGGRTYICPLHSIALSRAHAIADQQQDMVQTAAHGQSGYGVAGVVTGTAPSNTEQTLLNDVTFTQYHVFRAETRILAGTASDLPPLGTLAAQPPALETASVPPNPDTANSPADSSLAAAKPEPPPTPEPPVAPEITFSDRAELPDAPLQPQPAAASGFRLRTTTRLVDVGLVAYDKKGHPVTDLKQGDFELYDNGRKQDIKYFAQAGTSAAPPPAAPPPASPQPVFSNRQSTPALQSRTAAPENTATVLLIDSTSLAWSDLQYARQEMLRFLKTVPADEPIGLYILRSFSFQVLLEPTPDHPLVAKTLTAWMPDSLELQRAQQEEQRHREHFDTVNSVYDLASLNGNESPDPSTYTSGTGVADALAHPTDARLRPLGSNPEGDSLSGLIGVGRHLAAIAGKKSLIWISSDNVLADWSNQSSPRPDERGPEFLHSAALRIQETLNEAHVSLYPLDASQLEPGGIGADIARVNIVPFDQSDRSKQQAALGDAAPANKPGRLTAQMHQDTHAIQPEFRELAEATGGRALRRAGDIAAELNGIAGDGRAAYLLSFAPDTPADGKYHLITVKLTGRRDLKLRYRTGYLYEQEPATLKDRFRQAIFQPRDLNDIALTATLESPGKAAHLKLTIAVTDLEMAQSGDRWTDKLDIFLVQRDDAALHAKSTGRTLALNLLSTTYQRALGEGIVVDQPLPAKVAAGSLRILVVDENSRRIGSLTLPSSALHVP